jgi:hypothetical protein
MERISFSDIPTNYNTLKRSYGQDQHNQLIYAQTTCKHHALEYDGVVVTLQTCIWNILVLYTGKDTGYNHRSFS